jgi:hypothetical protein
MTGHATVLAASHMSATSAHALAWAVIAVVLIRAASALLWLLGWR